ncbi:Arginine biosynthesis bifunctional protein ArgJ [Austwickia sp. TVS 96-490-7B]|uniref:bifunctional glutamate N-acetyltransferase/amino-acid acetyltransferase ArgJ n=1 Tax=Austwickia sp. TVS 96-490-7B TaxID=2830843 RepID=UPI001C5788AD|nr:bifunctional glutamate N-acetyltransferase/amino-acid acetyltransferase ArgJ [Austwickia sp. TVS 96-490-7B]MBW3084369.1 Arginine biosynthesis bifunctional protein ArgJ [Austwickia sp. TVS 96-490-7B]
MTVTFPRGFRAAGAAAGIKSSRARDVAVVVNDGPLQVGAGVFTSNRVEAAPVSWSRSCLRDGRALAVIVNSGCANACTGAQGLADTRRTAERVAQRWGCAAQDVVVCSTGLIGELLPMDRLLAGVDEALATVSDAGGLAAAEAIMTTDTVPKTAICDVGSWRVGGMAKGAGMLAPALATMLVVLTTDAVISVDQARLALTEATRVTFDRVDSDGCRSTNDAVVLLASGASGVAVPQEELTSAVTGVCADLARQLIADAEGARHDIAIRVVRAASEDEALMVARAVARNNLVKCAIFGGDPNWGRIVAAVGTTTAVFEPTDLDVWINGVQVCRNSGVGQDRSEVDLSGREVVVEIDVKVGAAEATIWTNDLTHDYVHENSAYST